MEKTPSTMEGGVATSPLGSAAMTAPRMAAAGGYPIQVTIDRAPGHNRLYAVPALGLVIKELMLIPHLFVMYFLNIVVSVFQYFLWIPVLFTGKYPEIGEQIVGGTLRWQARVFSFLLGLTDKYPPFAMGTSDGDNYPVNVSFAIPEHSNRFFAVPVLGIAVKAIILIPHMIALSVLLAVVVALQLVLWIPVLFTGTYPAFAYTLVGGTIQWASRVMGYYYGLTDKYPPFSLS